MKPTYQISEHARQRMQQRAISEPMIRILLAFGAEERQKGGTARYYLPRKQRDKVRKQLEDTLKRFDALQDVYAVLSDSASVITVAHEYK